ncbi:Protein priB [Leucoagaricus sp. SymC.cos]|nr:Protein priB [Leucoagaricus sp. SymC.cos]
MLRRLEKGLNSAKLKTQPADPGMSAPYSSPENRSLPQDPIYGAAPPAEPAYVPASHFPSTELPPLNVPSHPPPPTTAPPSASAYPTSASSSRTMDVDDDDDDPDKSDTPPFPAKLIKQTQRNSFFRIILNNTEEAPISNSSPPNRGPSYTPPQQNAAPVKPAIPDPISLGFITEEDASVLFDALYLRLNPFINLFDPQLHTHTYVRNRCPFLFSCLIMAAAKFFKPDVFKQCQKLANDLAFRAFQEAWKSVEVVQAFACLTYWRDPEDNRTWTYIGYACRMAVELGLNRYVATPLNENTLQKLERRNRERTYLVLFIHDRSLSTQTGRHWMLPENDDLVQNSGIWHRHGVDDKVRPEDVIIAAFVELRRIAAETTDVFSASKGSGANDINYEVVLRNCNAKLNKWAETWRFEMQQAKGESFHFSFLKFFRLYVRVFLNYFGIASGSSGGRQHHSVQAHSICYSSAKESLQIVTNEFTSLSMLRYGQETITVMTAYSAIILLKLLRSPTSPKEVVDTEEVYGLILKTAEAYNSAINPANNAAVHARFLRSLVEDDKHRFGQRDGGVQIDPRLQQGQNNAHGSTQNSPTQSYPHQAAPGNREVYYPPPSSHVQQQQQQHQVQQQQPQPSPTQQHQQQHSPTHQNEYYGHSSDMSLRNGGISTNNVNGSAGGGANAASMQYYNQNPFYYMGGGGGMHATEQDQSYYKNMFIELGFGEPNPPVAQHPHQGSIAYSHHMPQHANYGQ